MADFFSSYLLPTSPPPGASLAPSGLEGEGGELAADTQDTASPAGGWIDEFSFMEGALLARAARGSLAPLSSSGPSWQREVDAAGAPAATAAPKPAAPVPKAAAFYVPVGAPAVRGSGLDGPQKASDPSLGTWSMTANMDKRTARSVHGPSFRAALAEWRAAAAASPAVAGAKGTAASSGPRVAAYVRKRPLADDEATRGEYDALDASGNAATVHACLMKPDMRRMFVRHSKFALTGAAFGAADGNDVVYGTVLEPLVGHVLNGGRATLFMYGQTGSGKTHTLGALQELAADAIFASGVETVGVTAVEVMGKRCTDLLFGNECKLQQDAGGGLRMCGAGVDRVGSADLLRSSLRRAFASRRTEATGANKSSSRSHAVVMLRPPSAGLLLLVDCAGSEWASDSSEHSAARRREGAEINASLHALKQCVRKHGERTRNGRAHVPYRESLLTRILAPVFECADARLAVIGCVSPGACDAEHSIATLRTVAQLAAIDGAESTEVQPVARLKAAA